MSVLDMFASALGAFIIISVILFPYFNQQKRLDKTKADITETEKSLRETNEQSRQAEEVSRRQQQEIRQASQASVALGQCRETIRTCQAALTKTFLVVAIEWDERCDIDLYVNDPLGNEFSYKKKNETGGDFPNSQGQLSLDMTDGPGIELWQNPSAPPGDYRVSYDSLCSIPVEVKGWVIDRSAGKQSLPDKTVPGRQTASAATVAVNSDGSIVIRPLTN